MASIPESARVYNIYALKDPRDGAVRYVGITAQSIKARLGGHIYDARHRCNTYRAHWIRQLLDAGLCPVPELIEVADTRDRERYWIAHYRESGANLTNLTDGGEAFDGYVPTAEARRKLSAALKGRKRAEETKRKISESQKGKRLTAEHRQKLCEAWERRLGRKRTEKLRRSNSEAQKGKTLTEEHKRKIGLANKGKVRTEEMRKQWSEAHRGMPFSEESRRKVSEANKGHVVSEDTRRKISEARRRTSLLKQIQTE